MLNAQLLADAKAAADRAYTQWIQAVNAQPENLDHATAEQRREVSRLARAYNTALAAYNRLREA